MRPPLSYVLLVLIGLSVLPTDGLMDDPDMEYQDPVLYAQQVEEAIKLKAEALAHTSHLAHLRDDGKV